MTIQDIGAIGEFIGAFLILATLVYLAIQNRHQQKLLLSTVSQARTDAIRHVQREMTEHAEAFVKEESNECLLAIDLFRLNLVRSSALRNAENTILQYRLGVVEEETFRATHNAMKSMFASQSVRDHWVSSRGTPAVYSDSLCTWIEDIIQEVGGSAS